MGKVKTHTGWNAQGPDPHERVFRWMDAYVGFHPVALLCDDCYWRGDPRHGAECRLTCAHPDPDRCRRYWFRNRSLIDREREFTDLPRSFAIRSFTYGTGPGIRVR